MSSGNRLAVILNSDILKKKEEETNTTGTTAYLFTIKTVSPALMKKSLSMGPKKSTKRRNVKETISSSSSSSSDVDQVQEIKVEGADDDEDCQNDDGVLASQFGSQENFLLESSQDGDQCDVRWDYTSPETMKHLKKMRGKYSVQDVKQMIANFPDLPIKPIASEMHTRFTIYPRTFDVDAERMKNRKKTKQRSLNKAAQRDLRRERRRGAVDDMINFLQQQQQKQEAAKVKNDNGPADRLEKSPAATDKLDLKVDNWSDDDLFEDNSFLIEATQNCEKNLPVIKSHLNNQIENLPGVQTELLLSSTCDNADSTDLSILPCSIPITSAINSSVIPSSYVIAPRNGGNLFFSKKINLGDSHGKTHITNFSLKQKPFTVSSGASSTFGTNKPSTNNVVISRNTTSYSKSNQCARNKGNGNDAFNKSSFQQRNTGTKPTAYWGGSSFQKPPQNQINRPRKTTNVTSVQSASTGSNNPHGFNGTQKILTKNQEVSNCALSKPNTNHSTSFDSSLTDDLLLQATMIVDTAIDTQSCIAQHTNKQPVVSSINTFSLSKHVDNHPFAKSFNPNQGQTSNPYRNSNLETRHKSKLSTNAQSKDINGVKITHSKPFAPPVQSLLKRSFSFDSRSPHRALKSEFDAVECSTSTPIKLKKSASDDLNSNTTTDSFMDDSFMNDVLFESHILPILELAETQVEPNKIASNLSSAQTSKAVGQPCLVKQKNTNINQAMNGQSVKCAVIQPSQMSSSQPKCSQEEIEKKRKMAQRKLLSKTRSLDFS